LAKIKGRSRNLFPIIQIFFMMLVATQTDKGDCMMKSIVEEKLVSFKELEQKIFNYICELGREITRLMLESYDVELASSRDTRQYRDKGKRKTTIKTVYGEVEYRRRVYQTTLEDGRIACVYLLDKTRQCRWIR
jgi:hypothetical protein